MNVLLLSQFFSTTRGGGEYIFSLIAKKLVEDNHKVWLITNKVRGENYEKKNNLEIVFVPPTLEYKGGLPPKFSDNIRYTINTIIKGIRIIKKGKIDIIHSNNFSPALAGSFLSLLSSKPHITTIHDVFSLGGDDYWKKWAQQNDVSKINAFLAPYFEKSMSHLKFACVHTGSEASREDLEKLGIKKKSICVTPYAIEFAEKRECAVNRYQFVYVGRLVFYKNIELILKAIKIVKETEPKIKLVIVGSGPHKKILEEQSRKLGLQNNVEFKGYVSNQEKERLICQSNALVFPSELEGFGLVILEAFSQHRPVIVSKIRPMSDIVSHNNNGYVLDSKNEIEWAEHLLKLINNPKDSQKMGMFGKMLLILPNQILLIHLEKLMHLTDKLISLFLDY